MQKEAQSIPEEASIRRPDKVLLATLVLGLIFCVQGMHWGRVEAWHPDQMAFVPLFHEGELPLKPPSFVRPPFHTYFNFFLAHMPALTAAQLVDAPLATTRSVDLVVSRTLTMLLFLGSVVLSYCISKRAFGRFAARATALILATSAGFVALSHSLTADIPLVSWMLLSLYFAQSILVEGRTTDYALAGFFAGIATATKYNGLAVGIAIVVAHWLSLNPFSWKQALISKRFFTGLAMVLIGFVLANPFSILDYRAFISDFMYTYTITPVYGGITGGTSYLRFFARFVEIIGLPSLILLTIALLVSVHSLFFKKAPSIAKKTFLVLLSVALVYFWKFGSFPRLPARFVAPVVPLWLIMAGAFWDRVRPRRVLVAGLLAAIVTYNVICSLYVGQRFVQDPRMEAQAWARSNIPGGSSIESTPYTPTWNKLGGVNLDDTRTPLLSVAERLFQDVAPDTRWVEVDFNQEEEGIEWFSIEQLLSRKPDYMAVDSLYYSRFTRNDSPASAYYSSVDAYFTDLLDEKYPYQIVFDKETNEVPTWIYPHDIDVLHNRIVILQKE